MAVYNSDELKVVLEEYGDMVYRMALVQGKNTETADAIYQKVFLKLIKRQTQVPSGETLRRWLLQKVLKCRTKRTGYGRTGAITECVQMLPEKYRVLFHLHFYEGYKAQEIAAFLYPEEPVVEDRLKKGTERLEKIMEYERVREPENALVRYREEMDAVKHTSELDLKLLEQADKPSRKPMTPKRLFATTVIGALVLLFLFSAWDMMLLYNVPNYIPYLLSSIEKEKIVLDDVTPVSFNLDNFVEESGVENWSKRDQITCYYDTYKEFYECTGLELWGADKIELYDFYVNIDFTGEKPQITQSNPVYTSGKTGYFSSWFNLNEEVYRYSAYFKIEDLTAEEDILKMNWEKANFAYEYREGKTAFFLDTGFYGGPPFEQRVFFVEDGILYCISNVDSALEATEEVKEILDLMAGE